MPATFEGAVIYCAHCRKPNLLHTKSSHDGEFAITCKSCGKRNLYSTSVINIETLPERRKKER